MRTMQSHTDSDQECNGIERLICGSSQVTTQKQQ